MNCNECVSNKVCFMQNQIESLADRITQKPFYSWADIHADRSKALEQCEKRDEHREKICYELKKVIASNCRLFKESKCND